MGYESKNFGFESSHEQVDASLSADSVDAGSTEITESADQYDFDEADVGEYEPEGEIPEETVEESVETSEIPEAAGDVPAETGELELDENDFDEADVGEYDPESVEGDVEIPDSSVESGYEGAEAFQEAAEDSFDEADVGEYDPETVEGDVEIPDSGVESGYEGAEAFQEAAEDSFDEADVGEYDPEFVEAGQDESLEPDSDYDTEFMEGGAEEDPEINSVSEDTEVDGENPEGTVEYTEDVEESSEDLEEGPETEEENPEDIEEDTEFDEGNPEDVEEDTVSDEENPEDAEEDTESNEENPEDVEEDTVSDEENPEDGEEDTESDEENPEDGEEDTEADEENPEDVEEDTESDEESPKDVEEDTESDEENPEDAEENTESDEENPEDGEENTESDEENPEDTEENTESDEENPEDGEEDTESDEENPEDVEEDTEADEENPEDVEEDTESDEESPEDVEEDTESDGENPEDVEEDTEFDEENPEDVEEGTESDEENPEDVEEEAETNEEIPEDTEEDTESGEERREDQQWSEPNGEKNVRPEGDREREDIAQDPEDRQREWHSFIGAAERERPSGVMAMGVGAAASEVAAMRREEIRQARNAETPDLHKGETVSTLRKGHEQTIIAATEDKLEDHQPPEMFPKTRTEAGTENHPERDDLIDYSDKRPEEPAADRESEKKADDGPDADPDQDAAGQIAQAAQVVTAGLAPGAPDGPSGISGEPEGPPNGPDEPSSGPSGLGGQSNDRHSLEQRGSRIRVEIPLMTGRQFGSAPVGKALQFGQSLTQLQRLVSQVPIPTNEMQGDAALADMIARMGVPPMRLGFPGNAVTMEDVRAFRDSRGLHWLRLEDRKSLVLVDASNKAYVQGLKELAEPDDTRPEAENQAEAPDIPAEEFERNLEDFHEDEAAIYEQQKQFDAQEKWLRRYRKTLLGDYTCHGLEHIREVMGEGERYLDALEEAGFEVPESLRQSYGVAAKYHDIGMADSAGMELSKDIAEKVERPDGDFSKLVEYYNLDPNATRESTEARTQELVNAAGDDERKSKAARDTGRVQILILKAKVSAEKLGRMSPDDPKRANTEKTYRGHLAELQDIVHADMRNSHARKSAEYVLGHGDEFKERYGKNVGPRNVACAIMLHTKTNSGCGDLAALTAETAGPNHLSVEESCSRLVADWNLNHGDQRVKTTFSEADLKEIAFVASVLRTADNRRDGATATFTNGDRVVCEASRRRAQVYHGEEKNGAVEKIRRVESFESENIIAAESCAQFGEIRPEGSDMVHVMRFNGTGSAPLEQGFAQRRIVDYVGEIESGLFKSAVHGSEAADGLFSGRNILEVHVPGASKADCARLEQAWRQSLTNAKKDAARQYGAAGRLRVLPVEKEDDA